MTVMNFIEGKNSCLVDDKQVGRSMQQPKNQYVQGCTRKKKKNSQKETS